MVRWMGGWIDEWMNRRMDGWKSTMIDIQVLWLYECTNNTYIHYIQQIIYNM